MLLLDETSYVETAVKSTYCLFYRRINPDYEADSFSCFARMIFSKKVNVCYCFEIGLAYKSRRFEEPLSKQQNNDSPLKTGRAPLGL